MNLLAIFKISDLTTLLPTLHLNNSKLIRNQVVRWAVADVRIIVAKSDLC